MKITNTAHASYVVSDLKAALHFYVDCLGLKRKFSLTNEALLAIMRDKKTDTAEENRPVVEALEKAKDEVWLTYVEVAPHQYIELFPAKNKDLLHDTPNPEKCGYRHLALEVDDIHQAYDEMVAKGVNVTSAVYFGPEKTYQFWIADPDGNQIELMQYTAESLQLIGNDIV